MSVMLLAYSPETGRAVVRRDNTCYLTEGPRNLDTPIYRGLLDRDAIAMRPLRRCPAVTNADRFREGHVLTLVAIAGFFLLANYTGDVTEKRVRSKVAARRKARLEALT
jgi:hypothetical protein